VIIAPITDAKSVVPTTAKYGLDLVTSYILPDNTVSLYKYIGEDNLK